MSQANRQLRFSAQLRKLLSSRFVQSAGWQFQGQSIQLLSQFAYFVIVAHALGPKGYGTFVACTALVLTLSPFGPWGAGQVLMKYTARRREELPVYFGNALVVTVISGFLLSTILFVLKRYLLPPSVPAVMLGAVALADLICTQLTAVCSLAFLAIDEPKMSAKVIVFSSVLRVVASLILIATSSSPVVWAYLYVAAAVVAVVVQVGQVIRASATPRVDFKRIWSSLREGFHFATGISAQTIYDNIDKTMLARLSTVEAAAIYAVAYRFVDAASAPLRSMAGATYAEFFRRGQNGIAPAYRFAQRILRRSVIYGLLASLALFAGAGLVPMIMGSKYADSAVALRWLSPLPLIKSIHSFLVDVLTGGDHNSARSTTQLGIAVFNVLINLWLIRAYSWRGASWSSIASDGALALSLYLVIRWYIRKESAAGKIPPDSAVTSVAG
jgi:O-antigen/teichoic acid export membrane protein